MAKKGYRTKVSGKEFEKHDTGAQRDSREGKGRYDLVAIVRVDNNEALAHLVTHDMVKLDGITHTESMLSFRAFSRHDLDEMFSIGL